MCDDKVYCVIFISYSQIRTSILPVKFFFIDVYFLGKCFMKLHHLNGLRAFEASARHLSFSLAAKELNVTPAAIGQQVKLLEEWLGISLFERRTSGV